MIQYSKKEGCIFISDASGKRYPLYEMECFRGNATSDILVIWDEDRGEMVNWVYGANLYNEFEDLDADVAGMVENYESKKIYPFTEAGADAFLDAVWNDVENGNGHLDFTLTHGNKKITLPLIPETFEGIDSFLPEAARTFEDDYQ